jgi:hypothetical protein
VPEGSLKPLAPGDLEVADDVAPVIANVALVALGRSRPSCESSGRERERTRRPPERRSRVGRSSKWLGVA